MGIASFFARSRWGSRWGLVDRWHPTPHKGLDIVHGSRTAVPALRTGRVVADLPSRSVGRYIVVQVSATDFDVYCHVVSRGLKRTVTAGETIAYLAGYGDAHGTAWTGPHLHLCRSTTRTGWAYWGGANRNPEPNVLAVIARLTGATSGTGTPVPIPTTDPLTELRKKADVMYRMILTTKGKKTEQNLYDLFTPFATLTGLSYGEAVAHKQGQNGESTLGSIDGTAAANKQLVADTRKLWSRIQAANIAGIRAAIGNSGGTGGGISAAEVDQMLQAAVAEIEANLAPRFAPLAAIQTAVQKLASVFK